MQQAKYPRFESTMWGDIPITSMEMQNLVLQPIAPDTNNTTVMEVQNLAGTSTLTVDGDGDLVCKTITTGDSQTRTGLRNAIIGGSSNTLSVADSVVAGASNTISGGTQNSILGGGGNIVTGASYNATIVSGADNIMSGGSSNCTTIAGGYLNEVTSGSSFGCFIGSGTTNLITATAGDYNFIGGGVQNEINDGQGQWVGGGYLNTITTTYGVGGYSSIVGGYNNACSDVYTFIGGGDGNTCSATRASIVGGYNNTASGSYSSVLGGAFAEAGSSYAAVLGGAYNKSYGLASTTMGTHAYAVDRCERSFANEYWSTSGDRKMSEYLLWRTTGAPAMAYIYYLDGDAATEEITMTTTGVIYLSMEWVTSRNGASNSFGGRKTYIIYGPTPTENAIVTESGFVTSAMTSVPVVTIVAGKIRITTTTTTTNTLRHFCYVKTLQMTRG